jgi:hypothetical protein
MLLLENPVYGAENGYPPLLVRFSTFKDVASLYTLGETPGPADLYPSDCFFLRERIAQNARPNTATSPTIPPVIAILTNVLLFDPLSVVAVLPASDCPSEHTLLLQLPDKHSMALLHGESFASFALQS